MVTLLLLLATGRKDVILCHDQSTARAAWDQSVEFIAAHHREGEPEEETATGVALSMSPYPGHHPCLNVMATDIR